jgi:hypothetical protein
LESTTTRRMRRLYPHLRAVRRQDRLTPISDSNRHRRERSAVEWLALVAQAMHSPRLPCQTSKQDHTACIRPDNEHVGTPTTHEVAASCHADTPA